MEDLVSKNASSSNWQYLGFKAGENGESKDLNEVICHFCRKQVMTKQGSTMTWRYDIKFWTSPRAGRYGPKIISLIFSFHIQISILIDFFKL